MTSNDVSQLPPELTRAGRLDAMWYFGLPTEQERREIFKIHFNKVGRTLSDELINAAASSADHFTGAEIRDAVKATMRKAFKRYKSDSNKEILLTDIIASIKETIPVYQSSKEKIQYLDDWAKGRARFSNGRIDLNGFDIEKDDELHLLLD